MLGLKMHEAYTQKRFECDLIVISYYVLASMFEIPEMTPRPLQVLEF